MAKHILHHLLCLLFSTNNNKLFQAVKQSFSMDKGAELKPIIKLHPEPFHSFSEKLVHSQKKQTREIGGQLNNE